jgi:hypothetical protein
MSEVLLVEHRAVTNPVAPTATSGSIPWADFAKNLIGMIFSLIIKCFPGYTDDMVGSALCRSKAAIKSKLMTLKREQKDRSSKRHAWWTDEEIANLTDMKSRGLPLAAIAAAMPSRSARALAAKWLKIVRRLNQNEAEQGNP